MMKEIIKLLYALLFLCLGNTSRAEAISEFNGISLASEASDSMENSFELLPLSLSHGQLKAVSELLATDDSDFSGLFRGQYATLALLSSEHIIGYIILMDDEETVVFVETESPPDQISSRDIDLSANVLAFRQPELHQTFQQLFFKKHYFEPLLKLSSIFLWNYLRDSLEEGKRLDTSSLTELIENIRLRDWNANTAVNSEIDDALRTKLGGESIHSLNIAGLGMDGVIITIEMFAAQLGMNLQIKIEGKSSATLPFVCNVNDVSYYDFICFVGAYYGADKVFVAEIPLDGATVNIPQQR